MERDELEDLMSAYMFLHLGILSLGFGLLGDIHLLVLGILLLLIAGTMWTLLFIPAWREFIATVRQEVEKYRGRKLGNRGS